RRHEALELREPADALGAHRGAHEVEELRLGERPSRPARGRPPALPEHHDVDGDSAPDASARALHEASRGLTIAREETPGETDPLARQRRKRLIHAATPGARGVARARRAVTRLEPIRFASSRVCQVTRARPETSEGADRRRRTAARGGPGRRARAPRAPPRRSSAPARSRRGRGRTRGTTPSPRASRSRSDGGTAARDAVRTALRLRRSPPRRRARAGRGSGAPARPRALLTARRRPLSSVPSRASITPSTALVSTSSTNAKPRDRPLSRSTMMRTLRTAARCSKRSRSSSSVVANGKLLTKTVLDAMDDAVARRRGDRREKST